MKKRKVFSVFLALVLIFNIMITCNIKVKAAGTTVFYSLSSSSVYVGDVFSIYVNVQGVSSLYGASIDTALNSNLLEVQSIKKVDMLSSFTEVSGLNNLLGIRSYAAILTGANVGVTGSGKVFEIVVKAKAAGTVVLKTTNLAADQLNVSGNNVSIKFADNNTNAITYTSTDCSINIKQPGKWVQNSNGTWSYLNAAGNKTIGWLMIGTKWYYFDSYGTMQTGLQKVGLKYYYFGAASDGAMKTGWQKIGVNYYYFGAANDGVMKTGWQLIGGKWYYFGSAADGVMKTGWQLIGSKWYYLGSASDGSMKTGWLNYNNEWYYLDASGAMKTGWAQLGAFWYYFYSNGKMAHDTIIDGKYKIGSDGRWIP